MTGTLVGQATNIRLNCCTETRVGDDTLVVSGELMQHKAAGNEVPMRVFSMWFKDSNMGQTFDLSVGVDKCPILWVLKSRMSCLLADSTLVPYSDDLVVSIDNVISLPT